MKPIETLVKWLTARATLLEELRQAQEENLLLRRKVTELQKARDTAEQSAQERRREKEVLRNRVAAQKKEVEAAALAAKQAGAKVTELREENDRLRHKQKK